MQRFILLTFFLLTGLAGGIAIERWVLHKVPSPFEGEGKDGGGSISSPPSQSSPSPGGEENKKEQKILYWWDPMIPDYRSDKPGLSPMGMEMVPVYAGEGKSEDAPAITIAPEVVNNLGVRTAGATRGAMARQIETVGYFDYDETHIGHVHIRAEGWIQRLAAKTKGERVKPGQLLMELYSPTLINAQQEYLQALAIGNPRLINASRQKLMALGISEEQLTQLTKTRQVDQLVRVFAHHGGVVSDLTVREGMYVQRDTEIMQVVDLANIWLFAEVFEQQAGWVQAGQTAEARVASFPGQVWTGTVDYIYPDLDPVTRTLRVRLRFANPGEQLKPKMYAQVRILSDPRPDVLNIPSEALIRDGGGERVVLALGEGRFQPREVKAGIESGDRVEILEGLKEGDTVVVSSQFLLDSEASIKASLERMESPALPPQVSPD